MNKNSLVNIILASTLLNASTTHAMLTKNLITKSLTKTHQQPNISMQQRFFASKNNHQELEERYLQTPWLAGASDKHIKQGSDYIASRGQVLYLLAPVAEKERIESVMSQLGEQANTIIQYQSRHLANQQYVSGYLALATFATLVPSVVIHLTTGTPSSWIGIALMGLGGATLTSEYVVRKQLKEINHIKKIATFSQWIQQQKSK